MQLSQLKRSVITVFSIIAIVIGGLFSYHLFYINEVHETIHEDLLSEELAATVEDLKFSDVILYNIANKYILGNDSIAKDEYKKTLLNYSKLFLSIQQITKKDSLLSPIFQSCIIHSNAIRNLESKAFEAITQEEYQLASEILNSSNYQLAHNQFQASLKKVQNYLSGGVDKTNKDFDKVFNAFERLNLMMLVSFIVVLILISFVGHYMLRLLNKMKDVNTSIVDKNKQILISKNALEQKNKELNKQAKIILKNDADLKQRNDDLLAAEEELRSNLEEIHTKNEDLERSEDRFKYLQSLITEGVIIHDNGNVLDVSESFCRLVNMQKLNIVNKHILQMFANDQNRDILTKQLASEKPNEFEVKVKLVSGKEIDVSVNAKIAYYQGKKVRIALVRDITERKKAEALLHQNDERYRLAFEGTNDGLWDWNSKDNSIYYSKSYKEMLGYADDELENHLDTWKKLLHPDDVGETMRKVDGFFKGDKDAYGLEFRMQHKLGHYIHILSRGYVMRDANDKINRIIGTHQDLSKRYELEEDLRKQVDENLSLYEEYRTINEELNSKNNHLQEIEDELRDYNIELEEKNKQLSDSEERFRLLFEKSKSVMLIINPDTAHIVDANESALSYYGYTKEEFKYLKITDVNALPAKDVKRRLQQSKIETRSNFNFKHRLKSGELRDVEAFTSAVNFADETLLYSMVIDRTEAVKAMEEIQKVNRRLQGLESIVHYQAKSINDLLDYMLKEIIEYTSSDIALFYHYDSDKGVFLLNNWSENADLSFEIQSGDINCLSKVVTEKKPIIINDKSEVYPFIKNNETSKSYKSVTIPVVVNDNVEAVVFIANELNDYSFFDVLQLSFLLETTWILVEKQKMQDQLKSKLHLV